MINSENTQKFVAGMGSGLASTSLGYPLEVLRLRLLYGNAVGSAFSWSNGLPLSCLTSIAKNGCIWPIQEALRDELKNRELSIATSCIISGGITNLLPNLVLAPPNIIKNRMMRDAGKVSCYEAIRNIYRCQGLRGFYNAAGLTMMRDSAWGMIYFPVCEHMRERTAHHPKKLSHPILADVVCTATAAMVATLFTSWIDAIRLHSMNSDRTGKRSLLSLAKIALAPSKANLSATFLGIIRVSIAVSAAHTSYETIRLYLKNQN